MGNPKPAIYAFICVRNLEVGDIADKLFSYLSSAGVQVKLLPNRTSIFSAYESAFKKVNPKDEDIVILCHDDIEILDKKEDFVEELKFRLSHQDSGFVGPAGTTFLGLDAVWWDWERQRAGYHGGKVHHKVNGQLGETYYGPYRQVVALDGLFLAAKARTLRQVGLAKPEYFEGEWDFYDLHYTTKAHQLGLHNQAIQINMIHYSNGDLVGRDSWHKNRKAFIEHTTLPLILAS